ncbi:bifunctional precorrin-2 dehydrogenase/sirohydrochlorin ferrochelatase MET8 NDAI_0F01760 [Naumovozyma dairenensis CBS 421]|uniref:precorrin-2 dehydrogenase n=1 Tax=Naumovozyma dairenensis (strain ATCC 10597 / BCRC 20456 / CBS 421 / NBRC 0211 / NRRL Y-12639) TaxID=1071378 RepID=G0WCI4_NAUDC|nr:hypothetical protein NDAI_0F01760 [Naumovozyma dairenensis CBS 421]CCD25495.1 hypothetical protein NDAI_0F01760 [Naumovozyma dairenensis CBS 421]
MGHSLQLAHQIKGKEVLIIGGGKVCITRLKKLLPAGSKITLVSTEVDPKILNNDYFPSNLMNKEGNTKREYTNMNWDKKEKTQIFKIIRTEYKEEYLTIDDHDNKNGWNLILVCISSFEISEKIYWKAKEIFGSQQLINVADKPSLCDFFFGANLDLEGGLQLMVSSNGISPTLGGLMRDEINRHFASLNFEVIMEKLANLRFGIRELTTNPDGEDEPQVIAYRMTWIKTVTDIFGLKYCENINVPKLLELFEKMQHDDYSLSFGDAQEFITKYTL